MAFLDELISGFPVVALPLIREDLSLSYAQVGLLFTAGHIASWFLEPFMALYSDRLPSKRPLVLGGLLGLGAGFALAGSANSYGLLLLAFTLVFPASGAAVGLSQATLIELVGSNGPRAMARWTLLSALGDLAAPLAVAVAVTLHAGWRALFWLAALLWLAMAALFWRQRFPNRRSEGPAERIEMAGVERGAHPVGRAAVEAENAGETAAGEEAKRPAGLLGTLWTALHERDLLRWTGVILAADMLDEVFLGFAALYLTDVVGADAASTSLALGVQTVGGLLGILLFERTVDRFPPGRRLKVLAGVVLVGFTCLLGTRSFGLAATALFIIGLGAAAWYPVAKAAAYASLPGRPGAVLASIDLLGTPFNALLPSMVGAVAAGLGLVAGLGLLGLAPLAVLTLVSRCGGQDEAP